MRRRCSSRRRTVPSATHCKSRSERFTALPLPECLARAAKQRARSSERTRCSTKLRSIRCAGACCTDSGSCFACAPNMPRRSRSPIGRKRSDRRRTIRCFCRPRAPCTGEVDQLQGRSRAARTWLERGLALAERLDVGPGEFLVDPQVALLGLLAIPLASSWPGRASARLRCSAHMPALAIGGWPMARLAAIWYSALFEVRLGNAERVAALADEMHALVDEFALAHGRTACRWFRGWADARMGAAARRLIDGFASAYEDNVRLGMLVGRKRDPGVCDRGAAPRRRLGRSAKAARRSAADRRQARRARVSAAAATCMRGRDRSRARRAHGRPTPRFGARSRRPERRRRRGSS